LVHGCGRSAPSGRSPSWSSPNAPASPSPRSRGWRTGSDAPASSCCCHSRRPTGCRWTTWSAHRTSATPGSGSGRSGWRAAPSSRWRPRATSRRGRSSSRPPRRPQTLGRTTATSGSASSRAGCACCSARRTSSLEPGRRSSSTPRSHTGSAAPARVRPRCWACSAAPV